MARSKVNVIDGLSSVQALRHAGRSTSAKFKETKLSLPAKKNADITKKQEDALPKGKIAHTTLPQKHNIVCYECGFSFTITGRLKDTICPKCHIMLEARDLLIETNWRGTIKSIGTVTIREGAILSDSLIISRNLALCVPIKKTEIIATNIIELDSGADFIDCKLKLANVCIKTNANLTITQKITCENMYIHGFFDGKVNVSNLVVIKETGCFQGELNSRRLIVEIGGKLIGNISIKR